VDKITAFFACREDARTNTPYQDGTRITISSSVSPDAALKSIQPCNLEQCLEVLRYVGLEPYALADDAIYKEIIMAGGERDGERVRFNPEEVLQHPEVSRMTKDWVRRLPSENLCVDTIFEVSMNDT